MKRKDFLKISGSAAIGLTFSSCAGSAASKQSGGTIKSPGLQLYSLREDFPKDPKGVLKQIAAFGYKEIESYEGAQGIFWGLGAKGFKQSMDELGMKIVSAHCNYTKDFHQKAADAASIGMKYLICPWLGKQKTLDDYKRFAEDFNKAGEICKSHGIRFAYHNHDYSFRLQDGQYPQDIMMQAVDPNLVDFEMDMYWVVTAGQDPVTWLKKYANRFKLCHIKDRRKNTPYKEGEENQSCIIGQGSIDYRTILHEARLLGMQHFIVEQEAYEKAPIACIKEDASYISNLKF